MRDKGIVLATIIVLLVFIGSQMFFTLDETETAIITQFGEFVQAIQDPGLHIKLPWIQALHVMDSRVLSADGAPAEFLTRDRKRVLVDYVTRWRISDFHEFYRRVRVESVAQARLDDIVGSRLRQEVAGHDFIDLIREDREELMNRVTEDVRVLAEQLGIEVLDNRIKRTDLPDEVQDSVFARMQAERHRIAMRYRAEGAERGDAIRADADRQSTIILAEAYERSESIRGEGDARAAEIYAQAYGQDEEFFQFWRRLNAYSQIIGGKTKMVIRSDSDLLRFLESAGTP
jgi:membrane protease subunit HflC